MRSKTFSTNTESELQRLRNLLDSAGDGFIMHDLKGNIVDANETLCTGLGYSFEELMGLNVSDIDIEAKNNCDKMWDELHRNDSTIVSYGKHKCKDGKIHPVEIKLFAIEHNNIPYISAFVRDISDRVIFDQKLNLTQFAIDHAADAAFWVDVSTRKFIYVNQKACDYLGYSQEDLLTMGIPDIDTNFLDDVWPQFVKELKAVNEQTFESELVKKTGTHIPVEITANYMEYEGKRYVVAFIREISARRKADIELREAKEKAEEANKAKSEFLTSMSHELKTPLNAIIGYSEMLSVESTPELSEEQKHFSNSINQAGHHLLGLIDDVLDLASIESGNINFEFESVRLKEIVDHSIAITRLMAQKKGVTLFLGPNVSNSICAWADKKKLTQVILNLISNAIKYNCERGSVEIDFCTSGDYVKVNIKDSGCGIPEEKKADLFSPFNRLGKENSDIEGTGVGLVICRSLIENMNGNLNFVSKYDEGSCFFFTLPKNKPENNLNADSEH